MSYLLKSNELKNSIFILLGSLCISLSVVLFFVPHNFTTGGTPGMAILLHHLSGFSIGSMVVAINIPLLFLGWKLLNVRIAIRSIYSIIILSQLLQFFHFLQDPKYFFIHDNDILSATLFNSLFTGIGIACILKAHSSIGGTNIIAQFLNKYIPWVTNNQFMIILDAAVIILSFIFFHNMKIVMFSVLSVFFIGQIADIILIKLKSNEVAYIITNKASQIKLKILQDIKRGATEIQANGSYSNTEKTILMCVANKKQISQLRAITYNIDPKAFIIIHKAQSIDGEGF